MPSTSDGLEDDSIQDELNEDAEDCLLVDFDDDFPFEQPPPPEDEKKQFILDTICKCMNPEVSFAASLPQCLCFVL